MGALWKTCGDLWGPHDDDDDDGDGDGDGDIWGPMGAGQTVKVRLYNTDL